LKSSDGTRPQPQPLAGAGIAALAGAGIDVLEGEAGMAAAVGATGAVHSFASGAPPSICARTSGIGGPP
jgi:hypothetical protein